jgi:hypothetical protein
MSGPLGAKSRLWQAGAICNQPPGNMQMPHDQMIHDQMIYGQMIYGQMIYGSSR